MNVISVQNLLFTIVEQTVNREVALLKDALQETFVYKLVPINWTRSYVDTRDSLTITFSPLRSRCIIF